jgi:hypothetical protein
MKSRMIPTALGVGASFIILLIFHLNSVFQYRSASYSRIEEMRSSQPASYPSSPQLRLTEVFSPQPAGTGQVGTLRKSPSARIVLPPESSMRRLKLIESSDPEASQLFKECFQLMDLGNYREAGLKLEAFIRGKTLDVGKLRSISP